MPPPSSSSATRWLRLAELGLVVLAGVWALVFQLRLPGRLPTEDEYTQLARHLGAHARPGDAVLLFPWWTERARLFVPEGIPVVGYQGSEADPLTVHPRIWVLSQPELPGSETSRFEQAFLPERTVAEPEVAFGHLRLTAYRNGRHRPRVFSLGDQLGQTQVGIDEAGGRVPCQRDPTGFRCSSGGAHVEWHEVTFAPHRCVLVLPPGGERSLVIDLPALPAAAEWSLEAGHIWDRGWHHGSTLTPSYIRLEDASGRMLAEVPLAVGLEGMHQAKVTALPEGPVRIRVSARNPELREICLELNGYGAAQ